MQKKECIGPGLKRTAKSANFAAAAAAQSKRHKASLSFIAAHLEPAACLRPMAVEPPGIKATDLAKNNGG